MIHAFTFMASFASPFPPNIPPPSPPCVIDNVVSCPTTDLMMTYMCMDSYDGFPDGTIDFVDVLKYLRSQTTREKGTRVFNLLSGRSDPEPEQCP